MKSSEFIIEGVGLPKYSWEDALDSAKNYIRKSRSYETEVLILQQIGSEMADQYETINADAYMHWGMGTRQNYKIVARVTNNGVQEL